ncbi:hypothetical protein CHLNCDRAFT_56687 [Chlorella variabilis]|uniref:NodB homology domain-containing protein n=1 Tax=Chlorella variabilis TaxID=554065 RepID=E1Z4D9_CHLVA|nr:hypothetical protein CHLNCDRAFT_56687 [Chlorella variabilis]EFN59331.1 hypothetical protein CHLNCDRAFT_56687 [Chlorella variabilis]|eukprot:XP_005851433.1 hypothetical protein CHLNCDRAFT_56687 [Chlorella variabilis]
MGRCAALAMGRCAALGLLLLALHFCAAQGKNPVVRPHDDEVSQESTKLVLKIADARQNPNGCKLPLTWFACTSPACSFECGYARGLHKRGHEIATHTVTHAGLRWFERDGIEEEIGGARDDIVKCGIPAEDVVGFRTPYLADKPEVRETLYEDGFRFDSTIGVAGGADKLWPATMEDGVPFDCGHSSNDCDSSESHPGMWQIPLYVAKSGNLMDYCTVEGDGSAKPGCSAYKKLMETFDEAYNGNRAPVSIGVHKPYLQKKQFHKDLGEFFDYALGHQDVWFVTHSQLLDWMEAPVPASQMKEFMARYVCP